MTNPPRYQVVSVICISLSMKWSILRRGNGRRRLDRTMHIGLTDDEHLARSVCADLNKATT